MPSDKRNCARVLKRGITSVWFCPAADAVHVPDEELLQEYILNENGLLYQGAWDDITSLPWNFGQVGNARHSR